MKIIKSLPFLSKNERVRSTYAVHGLKVAFSIEPAFFFQLLVFISAVVFRQAQVHPKYSRQVNIKQLFSFKVSKFK